MRTEVEKFYVESGFKILALARLSQAEYSLVLYLLNCSVSGLEYVVTNETELASLIGYDEEQIRTAIKLLNGRNMIKIHYSDTNTKRAEPSSLRIGFQFNVTRWQIGVDKTDLTHQDAVVYPFRRQGENSLLVLEGSRTSKPNSALEKVRGATWQRVVNSFSNGRDLSSDEVEKATESANVLVETHPVDQVLLMLRHFGQRIPTLSLLASSWQHYQEMFESETQKVDLLGARQKHVQLDENLRESARVLLEQKDQLGLSEDEAEVMKIIVKHRHPRRQLFWAYQLRSRYPKLAEFFEKNVDVMLAVTTGGAVVKKNLPPNQD